MELTGVSTERFAHCSRLRDASHLRQGGLLVRGANIRLQRALRVRQRPPRALQGSPGRKRRRRDRAIQLRKRKNACKTVCIARIPRLHCCYACCYAGHRSGSRSQRHREQSATTVHSGEQRTSPDCCPLRVGRLRKPGSMDRRLLPSRDCRPASDRRLPCGASSSPSSSVASCRSGCSRGCMVHSWCEMLPAAATDSAVRGK